MSQEKKPGGSPWTVQRTTELLRGSAGNELRALMRGAASVTPLPKGGFTLRIRDGARAQPRHGGVRDILEMTPGRNGAIESQGSPEWAMAMAIPRPGQGDLEELPRRWPLWPIFSMQGDHLADMFIHAKRASLFGNRRRGPKQHRVALCVNETRRDATRRGLLPDDREFNLRMANALARIADPGAWETARRIGGNEAGYVTVAEYNRAALGGPHLRELERTNPGAAGWFLAGGRDGTGCGAQVGHPGQIISLVRLEMEREGMDHRSWRAAARMPARSMTAIARLTPDPCSSLRRQGKTDRAAALDAVARSGVNPGPAAAGNCMRAVFAVMSYGDAGPQADGTEKGPPNTAVENAVRAGALLLRVYAADEQKAQKGGKSPEGGEGPEGGDPDGIIDYTVHLSRQGKTIRNTTWTGLAKASVRWHREMNRDRILDNWANTTRARGGKILTWNSLTGPVQDGELEAAPLTDEGMLHQEALAMLHCVFLYGNECARGESRIFSIRQGGAGVATGEIRRERNTWRAHQTRGPRNTPPHDGWERVMEATARAYTRGWRAAPEQQRHRSWLADMDPPGA